MGFNSNRERTERKHNRNSKGEWGIMKMRLETNIHGRKITILNTFAPHMCYNTGEREEYWAKIGETLKAINSKGCVIWGTDNNGQVAQVNKGKQAKNKSVGRSTLAKQTEHGNGSKLVEKRNKYNLAITNTTFTPKKSKKKILATWTSGVGGVQRQLDYLISAKTKQGKKRKKEDRRI